MRAEHLARERPALYASTGEQRAGQAGRTLRNTAVTLPTLTRQRSITGET